MEEQTAEPTGYDPLTNNCILPFFYMKDGFSFYKVERKQYCKTDSTSEQYYCLCHSDKTTVWIYIRRDLDSGMILTKDTKISYLETLPHQDSIVASSGEEFMEAFKEVKLHIETTLVDKTNLQDV